MYKQNKILAIIPARGGSKGIKNKNIIDINGSPLISYTIKAAKNSKYIDSVVVSTDSEEIKNIALKYGAEVPFLRDISLATDTSKTIDAIVFTVDKLQKDGKIYDYLVLLQPTSPLRSEKEIDEALELLMQSQKSSLVSISETEVNPLLIRSLNEDGTLKKILNESSTVRRQDFRTYYRVNGAIYINYIKELNKDTSFNDNEVGYIMDRKLSIDIDTYEDIEKVIKILNSI